MERKIELDEDGMIIEFIKNGIDGTGYYLYSADDENAFSFYETYEEAEKAFNEVIAHIPE